MLSVTILHLRDSHKTSKYKLGRALGSMSSLILGNSGHFPAQSSVINFAVLIEIHLQSQNEIGKGFGPSQFLTRHLHLFAFVIYLLGVGKDLKSIRPLITGRTR